MTLPNTVEAAYSSVRKLFFRRARLIGVIALTACVAAPASGVLGQDDPSPGAGAAPDTSTATEAAPTPAPTPQTDEWTETNPPPDGPPDAGSSAGSSAADAPIDPHSQRMVRRQSRPTPHNRRVHPVLLEERSAADELPLPWSQWQHMTGDWGGARSFLADHGVLFELVYTGEFFSAANGGDSSMPPRLSGLGNVDVTLTLDTKGLGWWDGGTFFVYFENLHGNGNNVNNAAGGVLNTISSLEAPAFTQLSAYYFQQVLFDGVWRLKAGKHDANSEFVASDITGEFINSTISSPVNILYPTFPDPGLGFMTEVDPTSWMAILAGVYGAELDGESFRDQGLFSGNLLVMAEIDLTAAFFDRYAGTYRFGGWYSTLETPAVTGTDTFDNNYGWYLLFDQPLYLEKSASDSSGQGLNSYFEFSWTPNDRNQVATVLTAGVMYTGAIPKRDADELAFAFIVSDIAGPGFGNETILEWFYKFFPTPWLAIQPDVQYVLNAGGNGPNAVVMGMRGALTF
ncbi:MAG: carbohydrate porin [Myxococcota bacterium]